MTEVLIDAAVVFAVLGLSYESGDMLVRLLLTLIEPSGQQRETVRSSLESG